MATSSFYNSSGSTPAVENSIQTAVQEAAGSATQAATSANNAATSETNAQSSLNSFQQYYLGAYSSAPTTTQSGAMYFDTGTSQLYIWSGTSWDVTASANNLQDTDGLSEGSSNLYFTNERVDDRVNALLTAGSNVTLTYNDTANTLTIASTASGGGGGGSSTFTGLTDTFSSYTGQAYRYLMVNSTADGVTTVTPNTDDVSEGSSNLYHTNERVDDRVNSLLTAGSNITLNYDDAANTLTIASTASGGGGIALTDLSVSQSAASGTGLLSYNNTTGGFTYIPPDLSAYATTSSLSSYLTAITGESLADLSDVNNATPSDGQVLTWDNANSYWKPAAAASGGSASINYLAHGTNADNDSNASAGGDNAVALGYGAVASGADSVSIGNSARATNEGTVRIGYDSNASGLPASGIAAIGIGWGANSSGAYATSVGYAANATQPDSIAIGRNTSADQSKSIALGYYANTSADNQLMLGGSGATNGFTSIRVGNTSYTPTDNMDLATKAYVDSNAGGGSGSNQSPNIVTGTYTTTSTSFIDAGEIVDTDDGFTGAVDITLHATTGTGTSMQTTSMRILFSFNSGNPGLSNWTTFPTIGNGINFSGQIAYSGFRWDTSTNKIYLQVKNSSTASTVYKWTAVLV